MSVFLYGAGRELGKLINDSMLKNDYILVDTYPENYPMDIYGHQVMGNEILKDCTSEDYVCITSKKYYDEIYSIIKNINSNINIVDFKEYIWLLKKESFKNIFNKKDNYNIKLDIEKWVESALHSEMTYWDRIIPVHKSNNDVRFLQREFKYSYNKEIVFKSEDIILDVGSGPLPKFGNLIDGKEIKYYPVDPLAHQYKILLNKYDVKLPIEPQFALMEILSYFYKESSFDYVIVNNALDHSIDILRALIECFKVVKKGGYLLLEHQEAEGVHENYGGMHQWNITSSIDNELIFFNKEDIKININKLLSPFAEIEVKRIKSGYRDLIIAKIKKFNDLSGDILFKYDTPIIGELVEKLFSKLTQI